MDYIFCSGASLHPRQVLMPPCRATLGVAPNSDQMQSRICSATPSATAHETTFSLASKVGIVAVSATSPNA
ncbi:unnamed protein product [Hydatigera taeniaeformis]|uniref:Uncharacterized protein n=1 Tax=Hydatigena taeniaeformis TaxID=6205 RepID=A0A0R3WXM0_HYDTA|nr:unnamed protein product [Hydatigera taeniaeformis]